jgi:hypothetical protein
MKSLPKQPMQFTDTNTFNKPIETLCSRYNYGCPNCNEAEAEAEAEAKGEGEGEGEGECEMYDEFHIPPHAMEYRDDSLIDSLIDVKIDERDAWIFTYNEAYVFSEDSDEEFDLLFENMIEIRPKINIIEIDKNKKFDK